MTENALKKLQTEKTVLTSSMQFWLRAIIGIMHFTHECMFLKTGKKEKITIHM